MQHLLLSSTVCNVIKLQEYAWLKVYAVLSSLFSWVKQNQEQLWFWCSEEFALDKIYTHSLMDHRRNELITKEFKMDPFHKNLAFFYTRNIAETF